MVALSRVRDVSSNQSNPVHPVYRCKLTPVVAKLSTRELLAGLQTRQAPVRWLMRILLSW